MPECIKSSFKYVSTLSCDNRVWQTIPRVDNPVSVTAFSLSSCAGSCFRLKSCINFKFDEILHMICATGGAVLRPKVNGQGRSAI